MLLQTLKSFLADEFAYDMFISGPAGTGKTTSLAKVVQYLQEAEISYVVCAYTHKACNVLATKLPSATPINTLHSFLGKRPGINDKATHKAHVDCTVTVGATEQVELIIIDEFSMVGEKDYLDLVNLQEHPDGEGRVVTKLLYVGDPYQLPPVKDIQAITPGGDYHVALTKVYRTECSDLQETALTVVSFIQGKTPHPLPASPNFLRGQDIVKQYLGSAKSKCLLAWTNQRVQDLNAEVEGRATPEALNFIYDSTRRVQLQLLEVIEPQDVTEVETIIGPLSLGTKYKTLEFLKELPFIQFWQVLEVDEGFEYTIATHFGTKNYQQLLAKLTDNAVKDNKVITDTYNIAAPLWCQQHKSHPLAKRRAAAWRRLLSVKQNVVSTDFTHAMTIHKSQGSTFEEVYLDAQDLQRCQQFGVEMYFKLFYVALTRASHRVVTN